MGYWLVMAMVIIAVIAVLVAIASDDDTAKPVVAKGRLVVATAGTNLWASDGPDDEAGRRWTELVRASAGERWITFDFARLGAGVHELRREQLTAVMATKADAVAIVIGPDDFRDAERLDVFERHLWLALSQLRDERICTVVTRLPDLTKLPSLLAEDDQAGLRDELQSWNASIARLAHACGAGLVDLGQCGGTDATSCFVEREGHVVLVAEHHRWLADQMIAAIEDVCAVERPDRLTMNRSATGQEEEL